MRARKWAAGVLCLAALGAVIYIASVSGSLPGTGDARALGGALGAWTLLPPVLAVALAFLIQDVIVSLLTGAVAGVAMLVAVDSGTKGFFTVVLGTFTGSCRSFLDTASDPENCAVLILCVVIGGMVEVIRSSGGFEALALRLTRRIDTPQKANLMGELLGIIVFFDDYANSLIVGPIMQPVTDKLKVSREKLAYLVDSTAAPVTGIAVISSWVAVEVSVIDQGLSLAGLEGSGYNIFLQSIPYCFYCIFCLVIILESSLLKREYGPMLQSEIRARGGQTLRPGSQTEPTQRSGAELTRQGRRMVVALAPILLLCTAAFISFYFNGRAASVASGALAADAPFTLETVAVAFGNADTIFLVMAASILGSAAAIVLGSVFGLFSFSDSIRTWTRGASAMMITVLILVLAWSLSSAVEKLGTVYYVVDLISLHVPWWLVPTLIFLSCCVISFAAGSYGCMFMVMPMAIPIACAVTAVSPVSDSHAYLLACIASVLSGSIFGDHCSPITDCTILSSMGSGCDNMDHVRTQMPYALTTAGVSACCGTLLAGLGAPSWLCLLLGFAALAAILLLFGRDPDKEYAKTIQQK